MPSLHPHFDSVFLQRQTTPFLSVGAFLRSLFGSTFKGLSLVSAMALGSPAGL